MLSGEPLMDDATIRNFNGGIGCHVDSALEQTLLLPKDMVELQGFRRSEIFLYTKRFLGMVCTYFPWLFFLSFFFFNWTQHSFLLFRFKVVQSTFRLEEMASFLLLYRPVSFFFSGRTRSSSLHYLFPFWFPPPLRITLFGSGG